MKIAFQILHPVPLYLIVHLTHWHLCRAPVFFFFLMVYSIIPALQPSQVLPFRCLMDPFPLSCLHAGFQHSSVSHHWCHDITVLSLLELSSAVFSLIFAWVRMYFICPENLGTSYVILEKILSLPKSRMEQQKNPSECLTLEGRKWYYE